MKKSEIRKVDDGKAEVLSKVKSFNDISFGHLAMAEDILSALGLDASMVMTQVLKIKKEKKEFKKEVFKEAV